MDKYKNIKILKAETIKQRFLGFMFKKNINHGLLFQNCNSIHTFFMKEEIDVIATDKNNNIIKEYKNIKPNRILICPRGTKNIYEMPKNTIK